MPNEPTKSETTEKMHLRRMPELCGAQHTWVTAWVRNYKYVAVAYCARCRLFESEEAEKAYLLTYHNDAKKRV